MKITFLGTAAAEGWPAIFCQCAACEQARKLGGKNIRLRSSLMIEKEYMMDFPPDVFTHTLNYNFSYGEIKHLLITHSHNDHCEASQLDYRRSPFAHLQTNSPLNIYGNSKVTEKIVSTLGKRLENCNIILNTIKPYQTFNAGELIVSAVHASHMLNTDEEAVNYIIQYNNTTVLIAHDTGWYSEKSWEFLTQFKFNGLILDCTMQNLDIKLKDKPAGHMGINTGLNVIEELKKFGCIDDKTKLVMTHYSHNGGMMHNDLEKKLLPLGVTPSYDGMQIVI